MARVTMASRGVYSRGVYSKGPSADFEGTNTGLVAAFAAFVGASVPAIARASVLLPAPIAEAGEHLAEALGKHAFHVRVSFVLHTLL